MKCMHSNDFELYSNCDSYQKEKDLNRIDDDDDEELLHGVICTGGAISYFIILGGIFH